MASVKTSPSLSFRASPETSPRSRVRRRSVTDEDLAAIKSEFKHHKSEVKSEVADTESDDDSETDSSSETEPMDVTSPEPEEDKTLTEMSETEKTQFFQARFGNTTTELDKAVSEIDRKAAEQYHLSLGATLLPNDKTKVACIVRQLRYTKVMEDQTKVRKIVGWIKQLHEGTSTQAWDLAFWFVCCTPWVTSLSSWWQQHIPNTKTNIGVLKGYLRKFLDNDEEWDRFQEDFKNVERQAIFDAALTSTKKEFCDVAKEPQDPSIPFQLAPMEAAHVTCLITHIGVGVVDVFVARTKEHIKVDPKDKKTFYVYHSSSRLWEPKDQAYVQTLVNPTLHNYLDCIEDDTTEKVTLRSILTQPARMAPLMPTIKSKLEDANFVVELNASRDLQPIADGLVVDLRTCTARERTREDMFTFSTTVKLLPDEHRCPIAKKYFEDICMRYNHSGEVWVRDRAKEKLLLSLLGYTLTGYTNKKIMALLVGPPNTSKTKIMAALRDVMGLIRFVEGSIGVVAGQDKSGGDPNAHTAGLNDLPNSHCFYMPEVNSKSKLRVGDVFRLVGEAKIRLRELHQAFEIKMLCAKLIGNGNNTPQLPSDPTQQLEILRKMVVIELCHVKKINDKANIFFVEVTMKTPEFLNEFFTLICRASKDFFDAGMTFYTPDCTELYIKYMVTPFKAFLDECIVSTGVRSDAVPSADLVKMYQWYCKEKQFEETTVLSAHNLSLELAKVFKGDNRRLAKGEDPTRVRVGLKWNLEKLAEATGLDACRVLGVIQQVKESNVSRENEKKATQTRLIRHGWKQAFSAVLVSVKAEHSLNQIDESEKMITSAVVVIVTEEYGREPRPVQWKLERNRWRAAERSTEI